jgi:hypothetical protein
MADAKVVKALRASASAVPPKIMVEIPDRDIPVETGQPIEIPKVMWPRQSEVPAYFGRVGENQTQMELPFDMYLAWSKSIRVRKITLHKTVAMSAKLVFEKVAGIYSHKDREALGLNLFGGSLNVRKMRGGNSYSMHSWGIAIDFDPERNQLNWHRPQARLSHTDAIPFWDAWKEAGWVSLGRERNFDWMHVQAARL